MQMILFKRIGYSGTAVFNFSVFNSRNEWITNLTSEINVLPQYDRLAKVLILKGNDGSRMELGRYRLEGWINDSRVEELYFELIDTTAERFRRRAYLNNEKQLCKWNGTISGDCSMANVKKRSKHDFYR